MIIDLLSKKNALANPACKVGPTAETIRLLDITVIIDIIGAPASSTTATTGTTGTVARGADKAFVGTGGSK